MASVRWASSCREVIWISINCPCGDSGVYFASETEGVRYAGFVRREGGLYMLSKSGRFAFAILLLILPAVAPAQQIAIGQYPLPDDYGNATGIAAGSDGALWFTEYNGNKIGRITTAGAITVFPVPTAGSSPMSITAGPDGALWFTESAGTQLGRITTAGVITEYPLQPQTGVGAITAGPDGALWFMHGEQIVRMTTPGSFTVYPGLGIVSAIAADPTARCGLASTVAGSGGSPPPG